VKTLRLYAFPILGLCIALLGFASAAWAAPCACNLQFNGGQFQCNAGACGTGQSCHEGGTYVPGSPGTAGTRYCGCALIPPAPEPTICHTRLSLSPTGQIIGTTCTPECTQPLYECVQGTTPCQNGNWTECYCK